MKTITLRILTIAITLIFGLQTYAQTESHETTIRNLRGQLAKVKTAKDSLKIYYDILDLSPRKDYAPLVREMYAIAKRAGDTTTQLDLCRQMTSALKDDTHFALIEEEVKRLPASDEQKETELFIKMKRISYLSRHIPENERRKAITEMIELFESDKSVDKYEQLLYTFSLVEYMRNNASGDMLKTYIDRLGKLADSQDFKLQAIPNIVYAETANIYSDAGEAEKAVAADRKLQEVIVSLKKKYADMGRKYRNYDVSEYVSQRRMLRNYMALRPGEAQKLYDRIQVLAARNEDVSTDLQNNPRTAAFYNMAVGNYSEAIPYLKKCLEEADAISLRKQIYSSLIKAAEQTGDNETRLTALAEYNRILEEQSQLHAAEKYRELQIRYDVKDMQERNAALELQNRTEEIESNKVMMTILTVAFLLMVIILVFSLSQWRRFKKNAFNMGCVVDTLRKERNKLHADHFLDYVDLKANNEHDEPLPEDWQKRFSLLHASSERVSTFMTESIINDLMNIALMGGNERLKYIQKISVDRLLREVHHKAASKFEEPADICIEYPEDDYQITTDHECLRDLLAHLIESTVFLSDVKSRVDVCVKHVGTHTDFIVTTSTDISKLSNVDYIFSTMFVTEDMMSSSKNGMYICRSIGLMLRCSLRHDKTYTDGARYIYTVPDYLLSTKPNNPCLTEIVNSHQTQPVS